MKLILLLLLSGACHAQQSVYIAKEKKSDYFTIVPTTRDSMSVGFVSARKVNGHYTEWIIADKYGYLANRNYFGLVQIHDKQRLVGFLNTISRKHRRFANQLLKDTLNHR